MNTTEQIDNAPAASAPVAAPNPELLASEWGEDGQCKNPEVVTLDFGAKRGSREAVFLLGIAADWTWRVGWTIVTKAGERHTEPCAITNSPSWARFAALRIGLAKAQQLFEGDAPAVRACSAMFSKTFDVAPAAPAIEQPDTPVTESRPLPKARFEELPVSAIERNPEQPRKDFEPIAMKELADSITSVGLLEPIVVRKLLPDELGEFPEMAGQDRYEIMAGERRHRAFRMLERATIPCMVYEGITRAQAAAPALVENGQREGLNPIEEAMGYRDLMQREGLTQEQCAQRVAKSRPVVANALRVLDLPEKVLKYIREGKLTMGHGTALARFKKWPAVVSLIAEQAVEGHTSAANIEEGVPFSHALVNADLAAFWHKYEFGGQAPAELKKQSIEEDYRFITFEVDALKAAKAKFAADKKAEEDAAAERERKRQEAALKNPKKIKSLDDLKPGSFAYVNDDSKELLDLVPDQTQIELKDEGQKVLVCTKPDLFGKIDKAVGDLKRADRKEKWTAILLDALRTVEKTKKLGARETMLLVFVASRGNNELFPAPRLFLEKGSMLSVKIPRKAMEDHYESEIDFSVESLALLMKDVGPLDCYRVLVDSWLRQLENDLIEAGYDWDAESDLAVLCKWILGRDELGFLEETKAGLKQLTNTVKAQEWYQRAVAEIEGREYVPPSIVAPKPGDQDKTKTAKKGGTPAASERIAQVKKLIEQGKTNAEIMAEVGISLPTLATYKRALGSSGKGKAAK